MKKRNGWCYAFWILIIVVLILALMVGLVAWGGSRNEDEVEEGNEATVASVSISPTEMSLKMGATEEGTLTATVTMDDGTTSTSETVSWKSSDTSVATVSSTGYSATVTAVSAGTTEITASVGTVTSGECTVTVEAADAPATIESVTLSQSTLSFEYGKSGGSALTATVTMSDDSDYEGDYTWSSSDTEEKVVKVTGSGATATVTPVSCGEAEITVSVGEGNNVKTDTCTVTVSEDHTAAEAGRITGSADVGVDYHFMFDDEYEEGTTVVFDDSSVSAEYDADTKTYTLSGLSGKMTADQATAFWGSTDATDHVGHEYIGFIVNVNEGETVKVEAYSSTAADATPDKTFTFDDPTEDTSFLVDIADHDGDGVCTWYNVLTVTYAGGDEETYTVVLGDIYTPASTQEDLFAAVAEGGDVALTQDITLTADSDNDPAGDHTQKEAATLTIGDGTDEVDVTLDLNGYTLARYAANSSGYSYDTIHVTKNATLIVTDSSEDGTGVVDVNGHGNRALYNEGTAILAGGFFERSSEAGMEESDKVTGTKDSAYTIYNVGDLTIEDGATVFNAGDFSTSIRSKGTSASPATLTINGGKVYGGKYAVGSGENATFTMTGGTLGGLRSDTDALPYRALNNYDNATITGGTLLGGNGGSIDVGEKPDMCVEGVVIFNEDGGTNHTLTIGDGNGNGPEIVYEGINPEGVPIEDDDQTADTRLSYYDGANDDDDETPAFATGIAVYSGEVDINAGSISCTDTNAEKEYNFMGVYITNGTLRVSGGTISGDEAIVIDLAAQEGSLIAYEISGGTLNGGIAIYDKDGQEVDVSAYKPGDVVVPGSDEEFTFNEGTFDGFSGLDKDFTVTGEEDEEITYTAGGITVTEIVDKDGNITVVVDGIVANQMTDAQKVAFDASYETDAEGTIRFYIAVKIAVKPGETVTVTGGEKTEPIPNDTDEVIYDLWVIEINQSHFAGVTAETVGDYLVVDISTFSMTVTVTDADDNEGTYTIAFGNVFVPLQAWRCADGKHAVSSWTVTEEETCATEGSQTGVCDYCGKEVTEVIPANGLHAATVYSDGNAYAVYMATEEGGEEYAWYAFCEVCEQWFEIEKCETCDIYDFVLVATDEASLNSAIAVAKARNDIDEGITQILVYGTITISDSTYVTIDCDNVEIYGLGADKSKIEDSKYDEHGDTNTEHSGVEIKGSNVTIRDLTIDGSKLDENDDHYNYEHGLEIRESAENVTLSNCVITGGTSDKSSAVVLMGGSETGYLLIENCTLSGYHGITIEHNGSDLNVTISGGTIDGAYGILIDGGSGVYLNVMDAEIYGKNSLTTNTTSVIFTNCKLGFGVYKDAAYGSINTYCDVTLIDCTFLSNNTSVTSYADDSLVYSSNNYVIQARTADITISLIDCEFVNTYENGDLGTGTLAVSAENFIYLVGSKSSVKNCYLYFDDSDNAVKYFYDATDHTVAEYVESDDENP